MVPPTMQVSRSRAASNVSSDANFESRYDFVTAIGKSLVMRHTSPSELITINVCPSDLPKPPLALDLEVEAKSP